MKPRIIALLHSLLHSTLGVLISALCAVAVAFIFARTPWKLAAPFFFAAVLILLSSRFGAMVSLLGSLVASLVFSVLLFSPIHSVHVAGEAERGTLAWMILLSVSASYLLFPSHDGRPNP